MECHPRSARGHRPLKPSSLDGVAEQTRVGLVDIVSMIG